MAYDVATLLAERDRLIGELAETRGRLGESQGNLWEAHEHLRLVRWLHAEAVWMAHVESNKADDWCAQWESAEASRRDWATEAMFSPRRREPRPSPAEVRPCSCLADGVELAARWSRPVCTVHPEGGAQ
jgi:hypothetical protein